MQPRVETLPKPFPIPTFRASTEEKLSQGSLSDSDRKYVVQTLATMLMSYISNPSLKHCGEVGKALIGKIQFFERWWRWWRGMYDTCIHVYVPSWASNYRKIWRLVHTLFSYSIPGNGLYTIGVKMSIENQRVSVVSRRRSDQKPSIGLCIATHQQMQTMKYRIKDI